VRREAGNLDELKLEIEELVSGRYPIEIACFEPAELDQILLDDEVTLAEEGRLEPPPGAAAASGDRAYGDVFTRRVRSMGIRDRPTAPRSPWQNGHVERLIGSIRRECLAHVVVFGE
jgi:hypothetical protein